MTAQPVPPPDPDLQPVQSGYQGGPEMTLMEHLKELRNRVIVCSLALIIGSLICFYFWETIFGWLLEPARKEFPDFKVASFSPIDRISTIFKIGLYGGIIIASPVIVYEILAFIVPGLTPRERKLILPALFGVVFFLLMGMAFAYWVVLPSSLSFLLNLGSDEIENVTGIQQYMDFAIRIIFWLGIGFEVPMVLAMLAKLGIVRARQLLAFWRYAIVIIAILAAVITPTPDAYTLALVAGPMLLLYFIGVGFAYLLQPRRKPVEELPA